ncbi:MAG: Double zinc ribbon [Methanobacterium sp. PtaU1.Bin097]|nr:MAG: Double zinc ribbon [Methanobacterium sp. PtaU1.Bin097]
MSEIKCPNCGESNPENAQVCQKCGASLLDEVEACLDITNPDTSCQTTEKGPKRILLISIVIIVILLLIITFILSFAPSAYWG